MPDKYGYVRPEKDSDASAGGSPAKEVMQTSPQGDMESHNEKPSMPPIRKGGITQQGDANSTPPVGHYPEGSHEPEDSYDSRPGEKKSVRSFDVDLEQGDQVPD